MIGDAKWSKQIDRVVKLTAARLSADIDKMVRGLPEGAAPSTALEKAFEELALLNPLINAIRDIRRAGG
jgi:hypothetical protein